MSVIDILLLLLDQWFRMVSILVSFWMLSHSELKKCFSSFCLNNDSCISPSRSSSFPLQRLKGTKSWEVWRKWTRRYFPSSLKNKAKAVVFLHVLFVDIRLTIARNKAYWNGFGLNHKAVLVFFVTSLFCQSLCLHLMIQHVISLIRNSFANDMQMMSVCQ